MNMGAGLPRTNPPMGHIPFPGFDVETIFWLGAQLTLRAALATKWSFLFAGSCGHGHASWLLLRVGVRARGAMKQQVVRLLKYRTGVNEPVQPGYGDEVVFFTGFEFGGSGFTGNG